MSKLEVTGTIRDRFVQATTLLYLLDPVRGVPTAYGLDQDNPNLNAPREQVLKRKFLDTFALICATRQDRNAVSAACLEEGHPEGTTIRIASNAGISDHTLICLRDILCLLSEISDAAPDAPSREMELLAKIVRLDIKKIWKYIQNLQRRGPFEEDIASLKSRLVEALSERALPAIQQFLDWFEKIQLIKNLSSEPEPNVLLVCIKWAQKAKNLYRIPLMHGFLPGDKPLPRWVAIVFKLGRYGNAAKILISTATKLPALFNPIFVKPIPAPPIVPYHFDENKTPLICVLRRVPVLQPEDVLPRLALFWDTKDPESFFRAECPTDLVTHAEVQMVNFYEQNQSRMPRDEFIGVSKKACYLCFLFLAAHPFGFSVSSCHQKIYPAWTMAPTSDHTLYKRYKNITNDTSKRMEDIAKEHLTRRLGARRSPMPADSTGGPSVTDLTESRTFEVIGYEDLDENHTGLDMGPDIDAGWPEPTVHARSAHSQLGSVSEANPPEPQCTCQHSKESFSSLVFHLRHAGDERRQDIIMIGSILDPSSHTPSWSSMIELLNEDASYGLFFQPSDIMIVNDHIQVRNERQFIACLQYLVNSNVLNAEVVIHGGTVDDRTVSITQV